MNIRTEIYTFLRITIKIGGHQICYAGEINISQAEHVPDIRRRARTGFACSSHALIISYQLLFCYYLCQDAKNLGRVLKMAI